MSALFVAGDPRAGRSEPARQLASDPRPNDPGPSGRTSSPTGSTACARSSGPPRLGPAIAIGAASQVAQGMFVVLFVVFVLDVLRADGAAVGLIRGVQAIGGIVAGLGIGMLHGRVSDRALVGSGSSPSGSSRS